MIELSRILLQLILIVLLSSGGAVEAEEPWRTIEHTDVIATCQEGYTNCQVLMPERFPCYAKMQEAMRSIDEVLKWNHDNVTNRKPGEARITLNIGGMAYREWRETMKECVR